MHFLCSIIKIQNKVISFEDLVSCLLAGLVAITAGCYTIPVWSAMIIGMLASITYFLTSHLVRVKLKLDDPLGILAIHGTPGLLAIICEGIFADETLHKGLIHAGYKHFIVQLIGVIVIVLFNIILCLLLWKFVMEMILFR